VAEKIILDFAAAKGIQQRSVSDQEIIERLIYPMINEGAKILVEGMAQRASDIDVVWIYAYGWPVYRGGPMFLPTQRAPTKWWPRWASTRPSSAMGSPSLRCCSRWLPCTRASPIDSHVRRRRACLPSPYGVYQIGAV
jgi:hypothetical protein